MCVFFPFRHHQRNYRQMCQTQTVTQRRRRTFQLSMCVFYRTYYSCPNTFCGWKYSCTRVWSWKYIFFFFLSLYSYIIFSLYLFVCLFVCLFICLSGAQKINCLVLVVAEQLTSRSTFHSCHFFSCPVLVLVLSFFFSFSFCLVNAINWSSLLQYKVKLTS